MIDDKMHADKMIAEKLRKARAWYDLYMHTHTHHPHLVEVLEMCALEYELAARELEDFINDQFFAADVLQ